MATHFTHVTHGTEGATPGDLVGGANVTRTNNAKTCNQAAA